MTYLLLIIGLILVFLEFYIPGMVLGILGGVLIALSIVSYIVHASSFLGAFLYILGCIAALILVIRFALWKIRTARPEYSIYSNHAQSGYVASGYDRTAIGKEAIVLSDLKPGGYINIEGVQHQAISQEGYITKGKKVIVIGGQEESLIVTLLSNSHHNQKKDSE